MFIWESMFSITKTLCYGSLGSLSGVCSQISFLRGLEACACLTPCVYNMLWVCVWECVHMFEKETLGVSDVLHSPSVLTSGQTAGLILTHTHTQTHRHTHGLSTLSQVLLCVLSYTFSPLPSHLPFVLFPLFRVIVHLYVSVFMFMFMHNCTCCLTVLTLNQNWDIWCNTVHSCVCLSVLQTGNVNHVYVEH